MKKLSATIAFIFLFVAVAVCQTTDTPGQKTFKSPQATVSVDIHSSIYTYKITNLEADRIVGFETGQHATYDFTAPAGWEKEVAPGIFKAYAVTPTDGIGKNRTAEFSQRVSSKGAILGKRDAKITFESGKTITILDVWTPVAEPKSYTMRL